MADLHAFHGVRYNPGVVGDLAEVVSAPYDVITGAAQRGYYERSPYNVVRLELGAEHPTDSATSSRYTRAADTYREWLTDGVLRRDSTAGFYVYDEVLRRGASSIRRRSLLAPVRLATWEERVVLPHEHTMPKPKADRLELLRATAVQFSPLMALYDDPGAIGRALDDATRQAPLVEFSLPTGAVAAAATTHQLWEVDDPRLVADLRDTFAPLQLYVADGHHRYETALAYRDERRRAGAGRDAPSEFVLLSLVETADQGLEVWPTHRVVRDLGQYNVARVLETLAQWFTLDQRRLTETDPAELRARAETMLREANPPGAAPRPTIVALGLNPSHVVRLQLRPDVDLERVLPEDPAILRTVDVVLLQQLVLERALGLAPDEVERGQRIQYTRDPDEAASAYANGDAEVVFFLEPTPVRQLREVVQAGQRFPQKTTYFYPKPVTGLVLFDENRAW